MNGKIKQAIGNSKRLYYFNFRTKSPCFGKIQNATLQAESDLPKLEGKVAFYKKFV